MQTNAAAITEHFVRTPGHETFYLQSGPDDGPVIVFIHGWPELSLSWRHVLPCFGAMGFRAVAPDMRGYGRSAVHRGQHGAYAQEHLVADMLALLDALGADKAVWVGHDWGTATAWGMASHHPDRCHAVANLCVPYRTIDRGIEAMLPLVDRQIYPQDTMPWGQWAYMRYYEEHFQRVTSVFEADPNAFVRAMFRRGNPAGLGKPNANARIFELNGWFGGADRAPDVPRDDAVLSEADLCAYAESLTRNGFFGPDSYYMNHAANLAYSERSVNGGRLDMPVLFIAGRYDITCESVDSTLANPMKAYCSDLTFEAVLSGHWMAQEKPTEVNGVLARWLATKVPQAWPQPAKA
ncbi:MAG: alpha/beta hydrolase [Burkholderiales bacterium]